MSEITVQALETNATRNFQNQSTEGGRKDYDIDGTTITVKIKEFLPQNHAHEHVATDTRLLYFPGWSMAESAHSITNLTQELADSSGTPVWVMNAEAQQQTPGTLQKRVAAYEKYLIEAGITTVEAVTGQSEGATEAAYFAAQASEEDSPLRVNGVVLYDPVGIYPQGNFELLQRFIRDAAVLGPIALAKKSLSDFDVTLSGLKAGVDIAGGIGRGIRAEKGIHYVKTLAGQIQEMAERNRRLADITSPVVIVSGRKDLVADATRIIPERENAVTKAVIDAEKNNRSDPLPYVDSRNVYLATLFKRSPYIRWAIGDKVFPHHGHALLREGTGKVGLELLRRYNRDPEAYSASSAETRALAEKVSQSLSSIRALPEPEGLKIEERFEANPVTSYPSLNPS